MAEYVEREWLFKWAKEACGGWDESADVEGCVVLRMPEEAPSVDAVEVVRCKDCRFIRPEVDAYTHEVVGYWCGALDFGNIDYED